MEGMGFVRCFQQLRSYCDEIETRNRKKFPSLHEKFQVQGVFQLQKDHKQSSTTPHIYIATPATEKENNMSSYEKSHISVSLLVDIMYFHILHQSKFSTEFRVFIQDYR